MGVMSVFQAFILGALQGITSVLPVSSSGHLLLAGTLMGTEGGLSMQFLAGIHMGTLLAVLLVWRRDTLHMFSAAADILWDILYNFRTWFLQKWHPERLQYRRLVYGRWRRRTAYVATASVCTMAVGLILRRPAERAAGSLLYTAMGFFVTALVLIISVYASPARRKKLTASREAVVTGLFQGVSVFPGVSRLGMVMAAADLQGLPAGFGVYTGYLLVFPAVFGGLIVEIIAGASAGGGTAVGTGAWIVGIAASTLTSSLMMRRTARFLARHGKRGFSLYCLAAGIFSLALYL